MNDKCLVTPSSYPDQIYFHWQVEKRDFEVSVRISNNFFSFQIMSFIFSAKEMNSALLVKSCLPYWLLKNVYVCETELRTNIDC